MKPSLGHIYRELAAGRLSQQAALARIKALKQSGTGNDVATMLATATWEPAPVAATISPSEYEHRHVLLVGLHSIDTGALQSLLRGSRCSIVDVDLADVGAAYSQVALTCFEAVRSILESKPQRPAFVQVVIGEHDHASIYAGLSALFATATLENPLLSGQIVLASAGVNTAELARQLQERGAGNEQVISYSSYAGRSRRRWRFIDSDPAQANRHVFKERGVYLITGGLGGLGLLFAREIQKRTSSATIILVGRSPLSGAKQAALDSLRQNGSVEYHCVDVTSTEEVQRLIGTITASHGALNGIIHSAGAVRDDFILKKSEANFSAVLAPKVTGACCLDRACASIDLDFFWLFSSIASWAGNVGQADYAAANGFLDGFAGHRNRLVAAGERRGHTLAIAWPHWLEGGMNIDAASMRSLQQRTGLRSLQTEAGMRALYGAVASAQSHVMVMAGDAVRMRRALLEEPAADRQPAKPAAAASSSAGDRLEQMREFLRQQLASVLKIPPERIDIRAPLEKYGIDSILAMSLTNQLEATFGTLPKTLFFEYLTLDELAGYFVQQHADKLAERSVSQPVPESAARAADAKQAPQRMSRRNRGRYLAASAPTSAPLVNEPIAIVGLSGRYPEAPDLDQFWANLRDGRDCIVEIPPERWDWRRYYSPDRTRPDCHHSKWGGFIAGVDEFDPRFFNIAPREAPAIDPQERLFLQHTWLALEDAGLTRASLQIPNEKGLPGQVGVYAGVMYGEYNLSGSLASIANRVSYFLNLHGPSLTLDTMCSSSLTAIHLACQDLRARRTSLAIAGGVNVSIHPNKYRMLSAGQFISSDGHCQSFGAGGDGYIPGEGVGVAILKRLSDAERDGNHIYGVIRGSALNHGGKTNGYTVPNPQAQADVIRQALLEANVDPRHVSYIEAHGTGTKLGDPIEIAALTKAFHERMPANERWTGYCRIGSAKSNIGHCESAAGIAGITKVLLQLKHRTIVPSLHARTLNPHIDFKSTPFVVNQELTHWERPKIEGRELPRIAGISSFGAGGSNAHVIIEEYEPRAPSAAIALPVLVPLSARTAEQLQARARQLSAFLKRHQDDLDLAALAYTLQAGREAMDERIAFVAGSAQELAEKLDAFVVGRNFDGLYRGRVKQYRDAPADFAGDEPSQANIERWLTERRLEELAQAWVKGAEIDWRRLHHGSLRLMSLPGYPFAKERYWNEPVQVAPPPLPQQMPAMHPLLHANTSNLLQQSYTSRFSGTESFVTTDASGAKVLPPRVMLDMIRAAIDLAAPKPGDGGAWEIREIAWDEPLIVEHNRVVCTALFARGDEEIDVEIYSSGTEEGSDEKVHCQSRVVLNRSREAGRGSDDLALLPQPQDREQLKDDLPLLPPLDGSSQDAGRDVDTSKAEVSRTPGSRREIPLTVPSDAVVHHEQVLGDTPATLKKPAGITLADNPAVDAAASTARVRVRLTDPAGRAGEWRQPRENAVASSAASVRLFDTGDGVLSIEISGSFGGALEGLIHALGRCAEQSDARALLIKGTPDFWQSDDGALTRAIERGLLGQLASFPAPVIAAVSGGATGAAFLLGTACDFLVGDEAARYGCPGLHSRSAIQAFLRERLGADITNEVCRQLSSGRQLKEKGWACSFVSAAEVDATATALAADLARKPQLALRLLKMHLNRYLVPLIEAIERSDAGASAKPEEESRHDSWQRWAASLSGASDMELLPEPSIRLQESAVTVGSYPDGVAVVTMHDRAAKNMFSPALVSGLKAAFEHIERTPEYKVVVLTGYENYFATGGTRETLLAIQQGDARFTDETVFQLPMDCPLPVIAAIQGHGIGGGWSFGMFADVILLAEESRYLSPYMGYGFTPGAGSTLVFPKKIGYDLARETLLTAREVSGKELKERGLQLPVLPRKRVLPTAVALARRMAEAAREELREQKRQATGRLRSLREATYRAEVAMHERTFVRQSATLENIEARFSGGPALQPAQSSRGEPPSSPVRETSGAAAAQSVIDRLRDMLAQELHLQPEEIEENAQFIDLGLDSITGVTWVRKINEQYGIDIEATKVYSHPTLRDISRYVLQEAERAGTLGVAQQAPAAPQQPTTTVVEVPKERTEQRPVAARTKLTSWRHSRSGARLSAMEPPAARAKEKSFEPIAVIGIAGQFPKARDLEEFWRNLAEGRDCIEEISDERWSLAEHFQPGPAVPGKTYGKWLGALQDYDCFDPLFFNISPGEAECMDPQQRLFLQACWHSIENAGYNPQALSGSLCGVFVGCGASDYHQQSREQQLSAHGFIGSATSILAARIAYFLNLRGPCISIDTACSSSLVAIANACDSLNAGNSDIALAGGVYVMGGPAMHIMTAQAGMLSADGRCYTFDQRANGFVPGEGVGVVMLKRLSDAVRDGDRIQAVIEGWGVNQDGRTNGITAPNEDSQTQLLQSVYRKFGIDPAGIQLIEAHGTGTKLGDPIEVAGLKAAFEPFTDKTQYCALGSVKSNIGHCLTAAGAAGFIKLVLAMKHRQLPPTIHYAQCNEHIHLEGSPFFVNDQLREWRVGEQEQRRAAISSFGFSGTNAHIVVREHVPPQRRADVSAITQNGKFVVCLSARTEAQLKQKALDLLAHVRREPAPELIDVAYTLQVGREPMGERLAILADSIATLVERLDAFVTGRKSADVFQGQVRKHKEGLQLIGDDDELRSAIVRRWLERRQLDKLAEWWTKGLDLDWNALYGESKPLRIELPVYPFARQRYWLRRAGDREASQIEPETATSSQRQHDETRHDQTGHDRIDPDKISYVPRWEEQASVVQVLPPAHRKVLIVCTDTSLGLDTTIREYFAAQAGCEVLTVRIAEQTRQLSATEWSCGIGDKRGFQTCLADAGSIDAMFFLATTEQAPEALPEEKLRANHDRNEIQLLRAVKCLKHHVRGDGAVDTYIVTLDNHPLDGRASHCWGAGAAGLGYSLAQGNHQFRVRNLDLSSDDLRDARRRASVLTAMLREPHSDRGEVVKLHAGHRYRQMFLPLRWGPPGASAIKQHGVYVIVGGAGIVGQIITRHLVQKYQAYVIWLGRSDPATEKIKNAQQLFAQFGDHVRYLQADVLDADSLDRALQAVKWQHTRINGAIFSGMVFGIDNSIERTTEAQFRAILDVKTRGSRTFHAAFRDEPLDFMCFFSSGQAYAFSGAAKLSAYAAGITFEDSFVRSIQCASAFPVGSINWGFWKSAVKERIEKLDGVSTRSLDALEDAEGCERFERFVGELQQRRLSQVLCMRASREVELLMNCKQGEFVMLGGATATPTAFPADAIDIPRSRIVELQRAQAGNELNQWLARLLFAQIHRMARAGGQGMPQTEADLRKRCRIQDKYTPWLRESLNRLAEAGFVKLQGAAIQEWKTDDAAQTWAQWQAQKTQYSSNPETRALAALASECLEKLPEILQGTVLATDVIFPNASMDKVAGLYSNNPVADTFNEIVASAVLAYLQQRLSINPHARLRILEIGAGTGGTSAAVFARLKPYKQAIERYCYTDLSKAFFFHAERNYLPEHPYIACQRLDIEQPLEAQGIELGSYDLVIATNVLHATQDIRKTLRHAKSALRQDGFIILNEMCDRSLPTHLTFGLLDGWWLFQDAELRIPGCPGLYPQTWQRVLENEGFKSVLLPAGEARSLGNQVIVARSDGVIRLQVPIGESQGPVQTKVETAPKVAVKRANAPARPASTPPKDLAAHIRGSILECLSATLKMPVAGIESGIAFSDYGIDSILGVSFIDRVNARFGIALNTAIIFEYSSVERLARHVLEAYGRQIAAAVVDAPDATDAADDAPVEADAAALAAKPTTDAAADAGAAAVEVKPTAPAPAARGRDERTMEIAIIGMSGQFPKAGSVREFWDNLMRGVDGVEELPPRYLNQATHFSPIKQKGKTRCKWGGILADRDCFDPLFFNISPKEAESMNPHQRLVMQESWNALEDAGYDARQLAGSLTGIFIGAEPAGYIGDTFTGLSDAIIASRLSYALDFKGPAFVVNTGCSSSAVAIHLACESLRNRESNLVLAGGVNACMHQNIQVRLDEIEMLSPSGRCYTFDKAGDGTIISEGIGMLVLKRLDDAIADGDHIYGTICASGMNQDGASNGITAPNGAAQEQLITSVYDRYGIDPEAISYVEAHGTGTRLGDPVETNALVRAFRKYSSKVGWCAVGSAKSHIGHAAAAAGVIGIIKVLLSMQHRQLPKLLNFSNLNPLIEFDGSPFFITTETREWHSPDGVPRMAAINSFGHSGTNVHLVLKEHLPHASAPAVAVGDVPVPLSAKTSEQLRQRCEDLLRFLEAAPGTVDLASLAYTLQTGREAMEHRVAFVADSVSSLVSKLRSYLAAEQGIAGMWRGRAQRNDELPLGGGAPPSSLLEQWVRGRAVDWNSLWSTRPKRMSLPGYPFAKERYWIDTAFEAKAPAHAAELVPDPALEQIIDRIEDDTLAPQQAVQLLRRIV